MKKSLLAIGLLTLGSSASAQVLTYVGDKGLFTVKSNTLVYSGGGLTVQGSGVLDNSGNVMIEGSGSDLFRTINTDGSAKTNGGNIVLRLNNLSTFGEYGQLYINGLTQGNITGIVDKEFRSPKHGTYQQMALPFNSKLISSLNTELGKTFSNTRWSKNEILKFDNTAVVALNYPIASTTSDKSGYYMVGSLNMDTSSNTANPSITNPNVAENTQALPYSNNVYVLRGVPYAHGTSSTLTNAGNAVSFGAGGNATNQYNEKYNTYLQDAFHSGTAWTGTYGKNLYQYGNPYFTNLDISKIGIVESATIGDGNNITNIQGVRYDPGTVVSLANGSTYSTGALYTTFTSGVPTGDVGMVIKPMQTFVIKLTDNSAPQSLNFDTLRRFNYTTRAAGTNYNVTAAKISGSSSAGTVKQLGVKGLDANGNEIARAYYVVYPNATSGHTNNITTQVKNSSTDILGTFEENPTTGWYDTNAQGQYWLYINEANEVNFKGKKVPLKLYSNNIASLKFEIKENAEDINNNQHELTTGIGFYYYNGQSGTPQPISNNMTVPVSTNEYGLSYGIASNQGALATIDENNKPSRTMVVFNPNIDNYIVQFDPSWKNADIKVFDMSGKLVISKDNVTTGTDFVIELPKNKSGYVVNIVSESGEKVNTKIIR